MLSEQEQRAWDDIQRYWEQTAEEPAAVRRAAASLRKQTRRERGEVPGWVGVGSWIAIFTVLFGAVAVGLALGAATLLGWALWRYWPLLIGPGTAAPTLQMSGMPATAVTVPRGLVTALPRRQSWRPGEDDR